jgi:hypothetical protein
MKHQDEFSVPGMVSVWIGDFQNDVQFDDYMNMGREFEADFGFTIDDRSVREAVVEPAPKPIADLVSGFSSWESFGAAVVQAAKNLGIERATTMIIFYRTRFDPGKVMIKPNAQLRFLEAFPFS